MRVAGADRLNLLQKLVSQDLAGLGPAQPVAYTLLLTPQGKYLYDFFVLWAPDALYLDAPTSQTGEIITTLNKYKLRSDVTFQLLPDMFIQLRDAPVDGLLCVQDPRAERLGFRVWTTVAAGADSDYGQKLTVAGVVEPALELISGVSMPVEFGLQNMHAISFTKGCYLGQELTARMHHRDLAKRVIVIAKFEDNQDVEGDFESVVRGADGAEIGSVLRVSPPIVLLHLMRYFAEQKVFLLQRTGSGQQSRLVRY